MVPRAFSILAVACALASTVHAQTNEALREQVRLRETAFAKTMVDRDYTGFVSFLSDEAVFEGRTVLRGKARIADEWKRYYEGRDVPFTWEPELVEVLDSGSLAMTSGPVKAPDGRSAGTFRSIWRREPDGVWRIVFDSGCAPCTCEQKAPARPSVKPTP